MLKKYDRTLDYRIVIYYDAMMIIAKVLEQCSEDIECIKSALYNTKDYQGAAGTYTFDKNGDIIMPLMIKTVKDGKFVGYGG